MSWLLNLYETYESNLDQVGVIEKKSNDREYTLLPISHTTQNAHIEVEITEDGEFQNAFVIDKNDANTLIPCTEKSASRAGSVVAPYPLHDKLSYVAGDFQTYGGEIKGEDPFAVYIHQLEQWAESPHANWKVKSIYRYLRKGKLIEDLVSRNILCVDENQRLIEKWDKKYETRYPVKPEIFSVLAGEQESALIRFNVYSSDSDKILIKVWKDPEMYESFIRYYEEHLGEEDICYVTGKVQPSTEKHANKIRNSGDKAKLISANDKSGFTFRGRFDESKEAASISYDVSQKTHNALKWLINRQGKTIDNRVFLIWGNDSLDQPDPLDDAFSIDPDAATTSVMKSNTYEFFAGEFSKAIDGYKNKLTEEQGFKPEVNIMVLDSATTGRMAVLYYRNMNKELYLDKIKAWHLSCVWLHRHRKNEQGEFVQFFGAPATKDIAFAAYGPRAGDKIIKGLMERMLPCIIDNLKIPQDIVSSAFHRASNPVSMEKWEWEKTLSIACALINRKEGYSVALDKENDNRDYLFGRLLAVADVMERSALGPEEKRATNAIRYMNSFSRHPERTWNTVQQSLQPYQARLGAKATYYSKIIDEIASKMDVEDFSNKPLSGKYLLGFYSQRHDLYQSKDKNKDAEDASEKEEN